MNPTALHLPRRAAKPRGTGLTMVIDGGIPPGYFTDLVSSASARISKPGHRWSPSSPGRAGSPASADRTARCGSVWSRTC